MWNFEDDKCVDQVIPSWRSGWKELTRLACGSLQGSANEAGSNVIVGKIYDNMLGL